MAWPHGRSRDEGTDEIPLHGTTGRLFLCGKHAVGPDPVAALERAGATTIVCLNDIAELALRYPDYVEWLRRNSTSRAMHHPVHDMHAPTLTEFEALIDDLHTRLLAGERLLVTCSAGIGRAGTVAVGVLIRLGRVRASWFLLARADDACRTRRVLPTSRQGRRGSPVVWGDHVDPLVQPGWCRPLG